MKKVLFVFVALFSFFAMSFIAEAQEVTDEQCIAFAKKYGAYKLIKENSTKEWEDNYEMQRYVITKECRALWDLGSIISNGVSGVPKDVLDNITTNAMVKWSRSDKKYDYNWSMVLYETQKQIEAYKSLNK